jgi:glutathione S-transferase
MAGGLRSSPASALPKPETRHNARRLPPATIVPGMMRIYHREHAGRPIRVAWVLEELGEPYEITMMTREEAKEGEEHRARHPLGRVPVLEDEEGFVFESAAICLHLADLHPDAGLAPAPGTHERALLYQWTIFAPAELEPPLIETAMQAQRDPDRAAVARRRFDNAAGAVSSALNGSDFLLGGRFTVADVLVGSALAFTERIGFADELPANLRDYLARLAQRPTRQRALERTSSG